MQQTGGNAHPVAIQLTPMDPDYSQSLEAQVVELRQRVLQLEQALLSRGILQPQPARLATPQEVAPAPPLQTPVAAQTGVPPIAPHPAPPLFAGHTQLKPADTRSLESRIGSQWFNRVGIVAVLIGMAWFLKFAIDNHWIGPLGRVLIGLILGGGLIAWSSAFAI